MRDNPFPSLEDLEPVLNPGDRFPAKYDTPEIRDLILAIRPVDADPRQMKGYGEEAYRRILYTAGFLPEGKGMKLLEIGSNPYKMTLFLKLFFGYRLTLTNFFGGEYTAPFSQKVIYPDPVRGGERKTELCFQHLNMEDTPLPYPDDSFDIVLLNEVIEHLVASPLFALLEIQRVLKKNGGFVVTTPNACSLEKMYKMICGVNVHDPYHVNGLYGRHNREYNRHELYQVLFYSGFRPEESFTADVMKRLEIPRDDWDRIAPCITMKKNRHLDLGQYIFMKCINTKTGPRGSLPPFIPSPEDSVHGT